MVLSAFLEEQGMIVLISAKSSFTMCIQEEYLLLNVMSVLLLFNNDCEPIESSVEVFCHCIFSKNRSEWQLILSFSYFLAREINTY